MLKMLAFPEVFGILKESRFNLKESLTWELQQSPFSKGKFSGSLQINPAGKHLKHCLFLCKVELTLIRKSLTRFFRKGK